MAIQPASSGRPFHEGTYARVERLRAALPADVPIQVDGGVTADNISRLREAGATLFVAASAIFAADDLPRAYRRLVQTLA